MEYFATSNGIPVHINDTIKGENVLLLLHGYLETLYIWSEFIDSLQSDLRVISIDLPGHGLSGSHPFNNSMQFCAEVVKGVLDLTKVSSCYICGHSLGGYVAQMCVKLFPSYFNGLILIDSSPFLDSSALNLKRKKEIDLINQGKLLTIASLSIKNMYLQSNLRKCDSKIEETVELCEMHNPSSICASIMGIIEREEIDSSFLNVLPILFIYGEQDCSFSDELIEKISVTLQNCKVCKILNTAHNPFIEEKKVVSDLIGNFLQI
jgi:pimeloyl-ACP methyl ester carboxylesterase